MERSEPRRITASHVVRLLSRHLPQALPRLHGAGVPAFRAVWLLALVAAIAGLGVSAVYNWQRDVVPAEAFAAFGLAYGLDVPLRLEPPLGHEASAAGVKTGDALVAIDGVPVTDAERPPAIAARLDHGDRHVVGLRTADGRRHDALLTRSARHEAETYGGSGLTVERQTAIIHVVDIMVSLGLLAAAVLLYARRPRDPVAALLSLSLLLLLASYGWVYLAEHGQHLLVRVLRPTAWLLMNAVLFVFPSGRFEPRWTIFAVAALPIDWILWVAGSLSLTVIVLNFVFLALAVGAIARRGRAATATIERLQIKWAVFGFGAGVVLIATATAARYLVPVLIPIPAAAVWGEALVALVQVGMVAFFALGLLVSLLRYRLYDADAFISRSATAAIVTLTLAGVFAATQKVFEFAFNEVFGHATSAASAGVAAALAALFVEPVHHRVRHWAEHRFQRGLLHLRHDLPLVVADLRETLPTAQLVDEVVARIVHGVHACRCGFLLEVGGLMQVAAAVRVDSAEIEAWQRQHHDPAVVTLDCDRDDPLFPLRIPLRDVDYETNLAFGCILLGPRPDGSFYSKDELHALAEVADPIARAFLVARRREAHEAEGTRTIDALAARLASLEELVASLIAAPVRSAGRA